MKYCCYGLLALLSLSVTAMPEPEFEQLDRQIRPLASQSYPLAIAKVDEILKAHQTALSIDQHIKLKLAKAWFLYKTGQTLDAMALLADTKALGLSQPNPFLLARYHNILGTIFTDARLYPLALQHLQQSLQLATRLADPDEQQDTGHSIGHVMLALGQYADARQHFTAYLDYVRQKSPARQAIALTSMGELALAEKDYAAAEQFHQQALAIRQQHQLKYHISFSWHNLAKLALVRRQYAQAEQLLRQVLAARADHQPRERIEPGLDLALALQGQGDLAAATAQLQQSIHLAMTLKDHFQLSRAWQLQTSLNEQQQQYAQAVVAMRQAMQAQQSANESMFQLTLAQASAELGLASREAEIERLQLREQQQTQAQQGRDRLYALAGAAALLLLLSGAGFSWQIRRKNRALAHSLDELTRTRQQLVEAEKMAALTSLVGGMAHQLNTPLGIVITAISCVDAQLQQLTSHFQGKTLNASQLQAFLQQSQEVVQLAQHNSDRAAKLIERFKQIATQLEVQQAEPVDLLPFARERLQLALLHSPVTLEVSGEPVQLQTSALLLGNILQILADNALVHAFAEQSQPQLWLHISSTPTTVVLQLQDNGSGIAPEHSNRVFEPFFTTRPGQGSVGLGLVVAYNSARELGGQLSLQPGAATHGGACFVLELPR